MPKPYPMTRKGKLHTFLKENADRSFTAKDLRVKFPNFKTLPRALAELLERGVVEAEGYKSGRWYRYKMKQNQP